jgi:hypothetical protein
MKIRLAKSYRVYEVYGDIEFDPKDYSELQDLSEQEVIEYLNENMYDFTLDGTDEVLADQFQFETDIIRDKNYDHEEEVVLVKDDE